MKDAHKLFELLDGDVKEIGEYIVVQVITDNANAYKEGGCLLIEMRTVFFLLCVMHLDLMLEKIDELSQHKNVLLKEKT